MKARKYGWRSKLAALALGTAVALGVPFCIGAHLGLYGPWYYAEARKIERLARAIPGVAVIEVKGNHDVTYEDIRLDLRYRGVRVYFQNVTRGSFCRWTKNLCVSQIGGWDLDERTSHSVGPVDFGPEGPLADRFNPPFRSIPGFLERLDEVKALVAEIPEGPIGLRVVTPDGRVHHIRKEPAREPR
jgi:hypothetical protein